MLIEHRTRDKQPNGDNLIEKTEFLKGKSRGMLKDLNQMMEYCSWTRNHITACNSRDGSISQGNRPRITLIHPLNKGEKDPREKTGDVC